jgi:glycosyltransferase involved in cell wall biosynthesis
MADRGCDGGVAGSDRLSTLGDVLVVTVRKSFWASPEAERWPRRLYAAVLVGHSSGLLNAALVFARALIAIWLRPPKVVLLGSVERAVPWFISARRFGLLRGTRLIVTNQLHLSPEQLVHVDRVVVYATAQSQALGSKAAFLPLPADGDLAAATRDAVEGDYVFAGGSAGRDYATLISAVRDAEICVQLVTFDPSVLGTIPENVDVAGPMPVHAFLTRLAGARVVAVPLASADSPHGQTTLVQALALGRPVVATRSVGVVDYVDDGVEGYLVDAGDEAALRCALLRVARDDELRSRLAAHARARGERLTYAQHADGLAAVCEEL